MTKLNKDHFFKAGARIARTSNYTRGTVAGSMGPVTEQQARWILEGFDAERKLVKAAGGAFQRTGRPLGRP